MKAHRLLGQLAGQGSGPISGTAKDSLDVGSLDIQALRGHTVGVGNPKHSAQGFIYRSESRLLL